MNFLIKSLCKKSWVGLLVVLFTIGAINAKQMGKVTTTIPSAVTQPITTKSIYSPTTNIGSFKLATFNYLSGSVMLVYTKNNQKYVILTREARGNPQQLGGKRFTYDDFSGAREPEDNDALVSAAREFHEEGNLEQTLKWSLEKTIEYVKNNTSEIIVYAKDIDKNIPNSREIKNVTYFVNFDKHVDELFNNFYTSLDKEKARYKKLGKNPERQVTTEKDKIAAVLWNDLRDAISYQKIISAQEPVRVQALIKDTKPKAFHKEEIVLRPFLAIKLRSFCLNKPYEQGENSKIRYYQD